VAEAKGKRRERERERERDGDARADRVGLSSPWGLGEWHGRQWALVRAHVS